MSVTDALTLAEADPPGLCPAIREADLCETIPLIPSENYPRAVLEATGSSGNDHQVRRGLPQALLPGAAPGSTRWRRLAQHRARKLFGAEHANVQPHSGSSANMAVYLANPPAGRHGAGDGPPHAGGHLTHGSQVNLLLKTLSLLRLRGPQDGRIDSDEVRAWPARSTGPG